MNKILKKLEEKIGAPGILERIIKNLSSSELNSFLLELYNEYAKERTPGKLMSEFRDNRFCKVSSVDPVKFREYGTMWLKEAEQYGFTPLQLSPLAPLGTCSAIALVSQNNVISAARGTEVLSDATNVLALISANELKHSPPRKILKYSTAQRHVRGQYFDNPLFSAHFEIFCLTTAGYDSGSSLFELENFKEHIQFYLNILLKEFNPDDLRLKVEFKDDNKEFSDKMKANLAELENKVKIHYTIEQENNYYKMCRFKIYLNYKGSEADLGDGGFTDWTQKLLVNNKQRLMISACGLEMIYKIKAGII